MRQSSETASADATPAHSTCSTVPVPGSQTRRLSTTSRHGRPERASGLSIPVPYRVGLCHCKSMMALQPHLHGGQVPLLPPPLRAPATLPVLSTSPSRLASDALDEQYTPIYVQDSQSDAGLDDRYLTGLGHPSDEAGTISVQPHRTTDLVHPRTSHALVPDDQMKGLKTKATIGVLSTLIAYVSLNSLIKSLYPDVFIWQDEDREERSWIASSRNWFDRKACRWLGLCGVAHFRPVRVPYGHRKQLEGQIPLDDHPDWHDAWTEGKENPKDWDDDERVLREIPDYVLEYAPLVHLYSAEQFWPCDIAEHLYHITPELNYTPVQAHWKHPKLTTLDGLNQWKHGRHVYLTSNDNVEDRPDWMEGEKNIPNPKSGPGDDDEYDEEGWADWDGRIDGELPEDLDGGRDGWLEVGDGSPRDRGGDRTKPQHGVPIPIDTPEGEEWVDPEESLDPEEIESELRRRGSQSNKARPGRSDAPAVLIAVDKGNGVVDAFWFYFYSFNLGNVVLNVRFGNHIGDWEHSLVRFQNGQPKAVFFSEHSSGEAYSYQAVEKIGKRPVIYSAYGTHAMYAVPGVHSYVLPWGLLHDVTDRGPLWDPLLNSHTYTYDYLNDTLRASNVTPHAPTEWFYFNGHWGDKFYPLADSRQYRFAGQYHYVSGPLGPRFKNLGRRKVCQGADTSQCNVRNWIGGSTRLRRWRGAGDGDETTEEEFQKFFANQNRTAEDM